jgi:hypothetical protein
MIENREISVSQINSEIMQEIVNVVLPNGETILHRLVKNNVPEFEKLLQTKCSQRQSTGEK